MGFTLWHNADNENVWTWKNSDIGAKYVFFSTFSIRYHWLKKVAKYDRNCIKKEEYNNKHPKRIEPSVQVMLLYGLKYLSHDFILGI